MTSDATGGTELLVISGTATVNGDALKQHAWLRLPDGTALTATAGAEGARLWMKTGHLPYAKAPQV